MFPAWCPSCPRAAGTVRAGALSAGPAGLDRHGNAVCSVTRRTPARISRKCSSMRTSPVRRPCVRTGASRSFFRRNARKKPYQVLTFHTTDAAMEMESFCKQNGIAGRLVPVPRRLSAGCGIAWRMEAEVYAQYQTVIADCGIEIEQSEALVL